MVDVDEEFKNMQIYDKGNMSTEELIQFLMNKGYSPKVPSADGAPADATPEEVEIHEAEVPSTKHIPKPDEPPTYVVSIMIMFRFDEHSSFEYIPVVSFLRSC